jgi:hypothetical protein
MNLAALLLVLAVAPEHPPDADAVEASVRRVLASEPYHFCSDPSYPLAEDEVGWCPLVGASSRRCDALPASCRLGAVPWLIERGAHGGWGSRGEGSGDRGQPGGQGGGREVSEDEPRTIRLPALGGLGQILLWILIGAAVVGLALLLAQNFRRARDKDAPDDVPDGDPAAIAQAAAQSGGAVETDVDRLLARARAQAARGEFRRAIDDAYAALLRRLDGDGLIRIHPARTNGDYVRDLRERPELRAPVREVVREVERVQFGSQVASAQLFQTFLSRVLPLCGRAALWLLVGAGLLSLSACPSHLRRGPRGSWDASPSGWRAVSEVLGQSGIKVVHRLQSLDRLGVEDTVVVLLPGAPVGRRTWERLLAWVGRGGSLVVASGASWLPERLHLEMSNERASTEYAEVGADFADTFPDLRVAAPEHHQLSTHGADAKTLLTRAGAPYAAWTKVEEGDVIVLADGYLLTNAALAAADNARFLVLLFNQLGKAAQFVDEATGQAPPTPLASVARGKLAPLLLQLTMLLGLFFWFKGRAFGTLRDPPLANRRAFVEHARAVGLQYAKARAKRYAFALYAGYALDRLRERVQVGGRRGLLGLAESVARKTGRNEGEVMRLLVEAQSARDATASQSGVSQEDLSLMSALGSLLRETGGSR